ncbi:hypothetical protein [Rugamonas aquatica]|uniref:Uncharacterized protein n=1 Tax=Rugamonas aquatica TaxID=2743357 RepID=A0A6A7N6V7_9BURK|nr:hypothetical protein [Rugamonas aquatica]MQA40661.1 hypothetical protein [Rugamonas aquatica]
MKKLNLIISIAALLIPCGDVLALGAVSRACQFSQIPTGMKNLAVRFFKAVGADDWVLSLPGKSNDIQNKYWILESLTTDYGRAKYYLYADSSVYGYMDYIESPWYHNWIHYTTYVSEKWTAETVSQALKLNPDFSPYYANRGDLYSARAGNPGIVEEVRFGFQKFVVMGEHFYFDPATQVTVRLKETRANDCNIPNLGFGFFDR